MARIFKQQYTVTAPDGRKPTKQSAKWYIEYRDGDDRRRRVPGYTDKQATQQLAAELERRSVQERSGLSDRFTAHRKRPLKEHLDDWRAAIVAKGNTEKHADMSLVRVRRVFDGCKFVFWPDLSASKAQTFIGELRKPDAKANKPGLSIESANHHLRALKAFCRWMVRDRRAPDSPLAHLQGGNVRTDRRHDRRALDDDELRRLLYVAEHGCDGTVGVVRLGMTGADRAMLYRLAVETGLRFGELASLKWADLDLEGESPTVRVQAAYAKNRRSDTLPLKPTTARILERWRDCRAAAERSYLANRQSPENRSEAFLQAKMQGDASGATSHGMGKRVFAKLPDKPAKMIRADLADARAAWVKEAKDNPQERQAREQSSFLSYRDEAGRVADFHSLRHTFISNLARGGVHPKIAQQLARHSTITLTMDRYSHTSRGALADALAALPDLSQTSEPETMVATGTDANFLPTSLPLSLPKSLPRRSASGPARLASDRTFATSDKGSTLSRNAEKHGISCTSLQPVASESTMLEDKRAGSSAGQSIGFLIRWERPRKVSPVGSIPTPVLTKSGTDA